MKLIQECPRICVNSMTIVNELEQHHLDDNGIGLIPDNLDDSYNLNLILNNPNINDVQPSQRCSRTFVSFTHLNIYNETFPKVQTAPPRRRRCPITNLPAQYFDPLTQMPYATLEAFRLLRQMYEEEKRKRPQSFTTTSSTTTTTSAQAALMDINKDFNLNNLSSR